MYGVSEGWAGDRGGGGTLNSVKRERACKDFLLMSQRESSQVRERERVEHKVQFGESSS